MIARLQRLLAALAVALGLLIAGLIVLGIALVGTEPVAYPRAAGTVLLRERGGSAVTTLLPSTSGSVFITGRCEGVGEIDVSVEGLTSWAFPCPARMRGPRGPIEVHVAEPTTPTRVTLRPVGGVRWAVVITDVGTL